MEQQPLEIKKVFSADSYDLQQLFSRKFLIPPYQRSYSWKREDILRLFEGVYQCINDLERSNDGSDVLTFLGTVIIVPNKSGNNDELYLANKYDCIIDGQQRISTFSLIVGILCDKALQLIYKLAALFPNYAEDENNSLPNAIYTKLRSDQEIMRQMLWQDNLVGTKRHYFPRVMRQGQDTYKRNDPKNFYFTSPLGGYLYSIIQELSKKNIQPEQQSNENETCKYVGIAGYKIWDDLKETFTLTKEQIEQYENKNTEDSFTKIQDAVNTINELINYICISNLYLSYDQAEEARQKFKKKELESYKNWSEKFDFCRLGRHNLTELSSLLEEFYVQITPDMEEIAVKHDCFLLGVMEFLLFVDVFIRRVVVTVIEASNESYAFSMFDSLNTTGQPLTAFETFKAMMVNADNAADEEMISEILGRINAFLDGKEPKKQTTSPKETRTKDLLVSFARASTGLSISNSLNEQRLYLKGLADSVSDSRQRLDLVEHLYIAANFWKDIWMPDFTGNPLTFDIPALDGSTARRTVTCPNDVTLCINMLSSSNHKVVIALLIKFYSALYYNYSNEAEFNRARNLFFDAVKAVAAFSTIYRAAHTNTAGIEGKYKDIFSDRFAKRIEKASKDQLGVNSGCKPYWYLQRQYQSNSSAAKMLPSAPSLDDMYCLLNIVKEYLNSVLAEKEINTLDLWKEKVKTNDIYKASQPIAKFMICINCAYEQNIRFPEVTETLLRTAYNSGTVEHFAPQKPKKEDEINGSESWDQTIYSENADDTLGNLFLLKSEVNRLLSNKSWKNKQLILRALIEKDQTEREKRIQEAIEQAAVKREDLENFTEQDNIVVFNDLADVLSWTYNDIMLRTDKMATNIWNFLTPWLDLNSEK